MSPTPYTKQTWVDGDAAGHPVSAARLAHIENGVFDAHYRPACRVYNSAAIPLVASTAKVATFDSERFDTDTMHSTASNTSRITFNTAGIYHVTCTYGLTAVASLIVGIKLNAGNYIANTAHPSASGFGVISTIWQFAAADFVEFEFTAGGATNLAAVNYDSIEAAAVLVSY